MTITYQNQRQEQTIAEYREKYSEEFGRGAQHLADEVKRPIAEVRCGLHGLGFRDNLFRKNTILALASLCASRFKYFETKFPGLKSVIRDWLIGAALGDLRNDQITLRVPIVLPLGLIYEDFGGDCLPPVLHQIADIFSDAEGQSWIRNVGREVALDVIAWKWLQYCVLMRRGKRYPVLANEFSKKGNTTNNLMELISLTLENLGDQYLAIREGYLVHGPEAWIKQYLRLSKKSSLLRKLYRSLLIGGFLRTFAKADLDTSKGWQGIKKKTKTYEPLSERQLLKSDWYYPKPSEEKLILEFFQTNLAEKGAHRDEALVLALSIATCRSVQEVLMMPFGWNHGVDAIVFKELSYGIDTTVIAVWRKSEHYNQDTFAELQLVEKVANLLRRHLPTQGDRQIHEVVHRSIGADPAKCYRVLAKHMGNIKWTRVELILRNYLIRCVYDTTTNAALARYFQTGASLQTSRADQIALGHYVKIKGLRVTEPYHAACKKIMGEIGPRNNSKLVIDLGTKHIDVSEMKLAGVHFLNLLASAKDAISKHNAFAMYTLLLLVAVTGHRKSVTPLYFPWDFSLENATVFISEKQSVGSEARFVPLCQIALEQIKKYVIHLDELVRLGTKGDKSEDNKGGRKINVNAQENPDGLPSEAIEHAQKLIRYFEINDSAQTLACHGQNDPDFSMFFLIDAETGKLKNMSTRLVDEELINLCGPNFTGRLRATVAQHLWEVEKETNSEENVLGNQKERNIEYVFGGREVQTFLGHHPEMHSFGPESALVFKKWADKLTPYLDKYAASRGLLPRQSPFARKKQENISSSLVTPSMHIGKAAYEGRQLNTRWAIEIVKKIIHKKLKEMLVTNENLIMDQSDILEIEDSLRSEIREKFPINGDIEKKLKTQLEFELKKYQRKGQVKVTAASINLVRSNPGPIDIEFSRSLCISSAHHRIWCKRIGQPASFAEPGNKDVINDVERYAHIAISLVSLDAVLTPQRVESLMKSLLHGDGVNFYSYALTLRTHIVDKRFASDFAISPCPLTSALILSLRHAKNGVIAKNTHVSWHDVEVRISEVLRETLGAKNAGKEWSLKDLCNIYKAFWHLILPGGLFAHIKGDFCGPAPTLRSERLLLAKPFESPMKWMRYLRMTMPKSSSLKKNECRIAYGEFSKIFTSARGQVENESATSAKQKSKLRSLLDLNTNYELNYWVDQNHTFELLVKFLWHLIEDGGLVVPYLAFSSIDKYFGMIGPQLLEFAWEADFEGMGVQDYSNLYDKIVVANSHRKSDCSVALKLFHRCLVKQINAPNCKLWTGVFIPVHSRSSLLPATAIETAINLLSDTDESFMQEENRRCALLIACANNYGLRRNEVMGLDVTGFDAKLATNLFIKKNRIRDLKSSSSRRSLVSAHAAGKSIRLIQQAIALADKQKKRSNPLDRQYLLESTESKTKSLVNVHATVKKSIEVLRQASGDDAVVLHSIRHTFATRLLLQIFCPIPRAPVAKKAIEALFGDMDAWTDPKEALMAPENWMFSVDALARLLGHAGIDTLLNIYFHGAYLALANFTHGMVPVGDRTNKNLASILNMEITKISRMQNEHLLRDAVIPFYISERAELIANAQANANAGRIRNKPGRPPSKFRKTDQVAPMKMDTMDDIPWIHFERLLRYRLKNNSSLDETVKYATEKMGIKAKFAKTFLDNYETLVKLGLVDYEHEHSPIAFGKKSLIDGLMKGVDEREGFLKEMQNYYVLDHKGKFRDHFKLVLQNWKTHLNAEMLTLLCTTIEELNATLFVLRSLGAVDKQLKFSGYGLESDELIKDAKQQFHKLDIKKFSYPSRGIKYQKFSSVGIVVGQKSKSSIPDGRDLHRALVIAACAITQIS